MSLIATREYAASSAMRARAKRADTSAPGNMAGRPWQMDEIGILCTMAGRHRLPAIAALLGRSPNAVKRQANAMGVSVKFRRQPIGLTDMAAARSRRIFARCYASMKPIIIAISESHSVSIEEMLSPRRARPIVLARRAMIWTVARDTNLTMSQIGLRLNLDHTTILHAIRREDNARGTCVQKMRAINCKGARQ